MKNKKQKTYCGSGIFTNKREKEYLSFCKDHDLSYENGKNLLDWFKADTLFIYRVIKKAIIHQGHAIRGYIYSVLVGAFGWLFFIKTRIAQIKKQQFRSTNKKNEKQMRK